MTDERFSTLKKFERILSCEFHNINLLDNALTHRSYVNENPSLPCRDNERLEFLGDAVLGACISDILMHNFPDHTEGQLSKVRSFIVNEQTLADLARKLEIGDFLLLGKGEETSGGRTKVSILSNTLEAVIAAIYLDWGFEHVHTFLKTIFEPLIEEGEKNFIFKDYKTALQEISMSRFKETPRYTLINETGPDHDKTFSISLKIGGMISTTGTGKSKKEAEQRAAQKALDVLGQLPDTSVIAPESERDG
jgi:ribonuclease III